MRTIKIAFSFGVLLLLSGCLPSSDVSLPSEYKCQEERCYNEDVGIQVNELKNNEALVSEVLGPFFFEKMSESLVYANCGKRCAEEGYNLFASKTEKVLNRLIGKTGYSVHCFCGYIDSSKITYLN